MTEQPADNFFISYSRVNYEFAVKLAKDLKSGGFSTWIDQSDIPSGSRWNNEVEKALRECRAFIVILSHASIESGNVMDEIGFAVVNQKNIIPILLEKVEIPIRLRNLAYVNFANKSYEAGLDELVKRLNQNSNAQGTTQAGNVKQESKEKKGNVTQFSSARSKSIEGLEISYRRLTYKVRVVAESKLNVRSGPDFSSLLVTQLNKNDVLEVLDEQEDKSGNLWACVGPNQWIVMQDDTAVKIPDGQNMNTQNPQGFDLKDFTTASSAGVAIGSEAIGSDVVGGGGAHSDFTNANEQPEKIDRYEIKSEIGRGGRELRNPYVGPRTFQADERDRFFGREREARELLALVEKEHLVLFYAQSGAGKSSLVNTSLIPDLQSKGYNVLPISRVSGDAPAGIEVSNIYVYNLLRSLEVHDTDPAALASQSLARFLADLASSSESDASTVVRRVLIVDQFEELFSTHAESWANREDFFSQLAQAMKADPQLWVVLVMREDYIASLDPYAQLVANRFQARYSMQRLGREAALQAIRGPVQGIRPYEEGAAEKLVSDLSVIQVQKPDGSLERQLGQYVEPIQLQVVCYSLWNNLSPEGTQITARAIQEVGDVYQSLGRYYDLRVREVAERMNVKESLIRTWFERQLITAGGIRNAVLMEPEKSGGLDNKAIQALQGDLVRVENRGGATWYELTHDRLVEPILESNRRWFDQSVSPLQRQAALWNEQNRSDSWLLTGQALVEVETGANEHLGELTDVERDFLEASRKLQARTKADSSIFSRGLKIVGDALGSRNQQPDMTNLSGIKLEATGTVQDAPVSASSSEKVVAESNTTTPVVEESEADRAIRMQAAIAANILANNRSQAVFNDKAQGEDQLGIKDEVEALAETLLLRDVEPPVSVGVMGGWGSGKSFAMYLIHQYVQSTRAKKVDKGWADGIENDPKIPAFVGHVYQINFNAWTYAKSNLWASLMDTIFSCLNRQMQLERLLAHRKFSPGAEPPTKAHIKDSMLAGGDEFKKIYSDNIQIDQDKDLEKWRKNLAHWSQHLLKGTLLWNVMRGQQVETLEKLKDTEEQLNQLKARREQFEKERPLNEITTKSLTDETARKAYFQSIKSFMLAFLSDQLSATAKAELKQQDVKEEDVQKFLAVAKGLSGGVNTLVNAFRHSKIYLIWTIIFLALFFAVPFLWDQYALEFVQLRIARLLSLFFTLLPTITVILPWIKKSLDASLEARKILEGAYATQQAKHAEKIANATDKPTPQKISELQTDISNGSLAAYDALIGLLEAQAEEQRQKIGPSAKYSNLMEFVQSRLDAATYENQLGLMHQVRQDIDELTYSLVDGASPEFFPRGKPRVILYIDDLDRCPPSRVVEVLEAVQLLLNTKLFIVILGLDTRYVTRALEKEYKEILQHEGDPSGLDYIEKIIQIPYRVRSIEADNLRKYIEKQMDIEKVIEQLKTADTSPAQPQQESMQPDLPTQSQPADKIKPSPEHVVAEPIQQTADMEKDSPGKPVLELPVEPGMQRSESPVETKLHEPQLSDAPIKPEQVAPVEPGVQASVQPVELTAPVSEQSEITKQPEPPVETKPKIELPPIELPAAVIQFKQEDLEDLAACCQKIALTPRTIKRLINVFKLMKIFWFRADKNAGIAERDRPRPVKQAAMSLLALSSAYPEVMREVFVHLETLYRQGQEQTELFTALNTIILPPGSTHDLASQLKKYKADIVGLKAIRGAGQDKFGQLTLDDLKLSTFNIVRSFSFVGDPVYWTDGEDDTPRSKALESEEKVSAPRKASKKKGN